MQTSALTTSMTVRNRKGRPRWVVVATFAAVDGGDPRCVDYRVQVVPEARTDGAAMRAASKLATRLAEGSIPTDAVEALTVAPLEGIPRYVFEEASQTRLLDRLREQNATYEAERLDAPRKKATGIGPTVLLPPPLPPAIAAMLTPGRRKGGRPPQRSLLEKLRILRRAEQAFTENEPLEVVAREFSMSRPALRDLLQWARHDSDPRLFTGGGVGRRHGNLTQEARALSAELERTES